MPVFAYTVPPTSERTPKEWTRPPAPVWGVTPYARFATAGTPHVALVSRQGASALTEFAFAAELAQAYSLATTGTRNNVAHFEDGDQIDVTTGGQPTVRVEIGETALNRTLPPVDREGALPRRLATYGVPLFNAGGWCVETVSPTHIAIRSTLARGEVAGTGTVCSPDGLELACEMVRRLIGVKKKWPQPRLFRSDGSLYPGVSYTLSPDLSWGQLQPYAAGKPAVWMGWPRTLLRDSRRNFAPGGGYGIEPHMPTNRSWGNEIHRLVPLILDYYFGISMSYPDPSIGPVPDTLWPLIVLGGDETGTTNRYVPPTWPHPVGHATWKWHPDLAAPGVPEFIARLFFEYVKANAPYAAGEYMLSADGYTNTPLSVAWLAALDSPTAYGNELKGKRNGFFGGYSAVFRKGYRAIAREFFRIAAEEAPEFLDFRFSMPEYQFTSMQSSPDADGTKRLDHRISSMPTILHGAANTARTNPPPIAGADVAGGTGVAAVVGEAPWGPGDGGVRPFGNFDTLERWNTNRKLVIVQPKLVQVGMRHAYYQSIQDGSGLAKGEVNRYNLKYQEMNCVEPIDGLSADAVGRACQESMPVVYNTPGDYRSGMNVVATRAAIEAWAADIREDWCTIYGPAAASMETFHREHEGGYLDWMDGAGGFDTDYGRDLYISDYDDGTDEADVLPVGRETAAEAALVAAETAVAAGALHQQEAVAVVRMWWDLQRKFVAWCRLVRALGTAGDLNTVAGRAAEYARLRAAMAAHHEFANYYLDVMVPRNGVQGWGETVLSGSKAEQYSTRNSGATAGPGIEASEIPYFSRSVMACIAGGAAEGLTTAQMAAELAAQRDLTPLGVGRTEATDLFLYRLFDGARLEATGSFLNARVFDAEAKAVSLNIIGNKEFTRDAAGRAEAAAFGIARNTVYDVVPDQAYLACEKHDPGDAKRSARISSAIFCEVPMSVDIDGPHPSGVPPGGCVMVDTTALLNEVQQRTDLYMQITPIAGAGKSFEFNLYKKRAPNQWYTDRILVPLPAEPTNVVEAKILGADMRQEGHGATAKHASVWVQKVAVNIANEPA